MPDSQTLFIAAGATGFLILLLSVLLGEFGGGDGELGHEAAAPGPEIDGPGIDGAGPEIDGPAGVPGEIASGFDAGNDIPEGSAEIDAPHWFSIRMLSVSLVGFGAAGFIASYSGVYPIFAWPIAAAGFLAVGAGANRWILKPLARQQYNSLSSRWGWVGRTGVVTLDILPHGTGQVTFHDRAGGRITQTATSDLGEGIPKGSPVTITDLKKDGVVVHRSSFSD
ncbi:NfeD family protein [Kineosporia babensis]|uniref:NfeD family protein n=1 Tax=Kineosporia babensis TaxID=499548 RepID=A0A9X1NGI3_9ACTN|nr:NfeD family protein [Kineosporia babensis]MCD5312876.1 NfeD family protein [Kineosporia babensis]